MKVLNKFKNWYITTYRNMNSGDRVGMIVLTGMLLIVIVGLLWIIVFTPSLWLPMFVVVSVILGFFAWIFNEKD